MEAKLDRALAQALFLISIPKTKTNENAKIGDLIQPMAEFFNSLHGVFDPKVKGSKRPYFSFEIVTHGDQIYFYLSAPKEYADLIERQLLAYYPTANLQATEDYNIFQPKGEYAAAELVLNKNSAYPIKTFEKFESDPLSATVGALGQMKEGDGMAIQIMLRPVGDSWRDEARGIITNMQQGKKSGGGGSIFKEAVGTLIKGSEKKKDEMPEAPIRLTATQEAQVDAISQKSSFSGFETIIRLVSAGRDGVMTQANLNNLISAFHQYDVPESNQFKVDKKTKERVIKAYGFRFFDELGKSSGMVLTPNELAGLFHLPNDRMSSPHIRFMSATKLAPPNNLPHEGVLIGLNEYRGQKKEVRIATDDRRRHTYVLGKTGVGKSVLIENMVLADIQAGRGVAIIDPHGDLAESILSKIPAERAEDVVYFNATDTERPIGINMLEAKTSNERDFAVSEMISIFYKLFDAETMGPMFEHYMRNAMLAIMADTENPSTLLDIPRILTDESFRREKLKFVTDPSVREFWTKEYPQTAGGQTAKDILPYVISKLGRFISNETMRNIIGQKRSSINFRSVMDEGKILVVNLAKGQLGDINMSLLGFVIIGKLQMAALARNNVPESERRDFYLYVDEFQNFATDSFESILSEARKYHLNLLVANQYIAQLDEKIKNAIFGNIGSLISFRVGADDAEYVAKQLAPDVSAEDLINIDKFNAYTRLTIDGTPSNTFTMKTVAPQSAGDKSIVETVRNLSRVHYGRDKVLVESEIKTSGGNLDFKI